MDDFKRDLIIIGLCCVPLLGMVVWLIFGVKSPQTSSVPTIPTTPIAEESEPIVEGSEPIVEESDKGYYGIGDTWTVPGQWSLTVDRIECTDYRNEFSEKTPDAVYYIYFTYENLGFYDETHYYEGLYFDLENETIIDADGEMGYSYPGDLSIIPQETPVGARCAAESCIGVNHAGDLTIIIVMRDGENRRQSATFNLVVPTEITPSAVPEEAAEDIVSDELVPFVSEDVGSVRSAAGNAAYFDTYYIPENQETSDRYVLNISTMKIHYPDCADVLKIAPENYSTSNDDISVLESRGYTPCGHCMP